MVSKPDIIKLLNMDLGKEYAAAVQYIQHAAVIESKEYKKWIVKEIKVHAQEEIEHAMILSDQIVLLGGVPTVDVSDVHTSNADKKMLEQDLMGEEDAIVRYTARIEQAKELKEAVLAKKLKFILSVEQEHARDLKKALKR